MAFSTCQPELRLCIYEISKRSLDFGHFSIAPPVTAVPKLVRRESISVFFGEGLFLIHREQNWPPQSDMTLQVVTSLIFDRAPLSFVHSLRRLEIMTPLGHGTGFAEVEIDLSGKERKRRAFFGSMGSFGWTQWSLHRPEVGLMVESVLAQLRDLVDMVVERQPVGFERADADAILRISASTAGTG